MPLFMLNGLINQACLLLDEMLFPRYRRTAVTMPVFIVGVPRSGTTFLHRLLARDEEQFTCMKLWELFFAPSIFQKKCWCALGMLDRCLGSPLSRMVRYWEEKAFNQLGRMHVLSLFEPEEDELLLLSIFSSVFLSFAFPFEDAVRGLALFDRELPVHERERIMAFYKTCVQRHLYCFGRGRCFLSKNPAFSPKIESLYCTFPDARIICMVRSPFEAIPSSMSLLSYFCHVFTSPVEAFPMHAAIQEMLAMWYRYPLEQLAGKRTEQQAILKYDTLVRDPREIVHGLYQRLGCRLTPDYLKVLAEEAERARSYKSRHTYSLEQSGLSAERIREDYQDILERFGFEPGGAEKTCERKSSTSRLSAAADAAAS
jgi:omega-hydroxy-beta-dihydromenaquinone-9 sulfotransferase